MTDVPASACPDDSRSPLAALWPPGSIIELLETGLDHPVPWLILPVLGKFNAPDRWVVWIGPPFQPTPDVLQLTDINPDHLRIIHGRTRRDKQVAAEQALASATNDIIFVWLDVLTSHDRERLLRAAQEGGTRGIVFCRSTDQPATEHKQTHPAIQANRLTPVPTPPEPNDAHPQLGLELD